MQRSLITLSPHSCVPPLPLPPPLLPKLPPPLSRCLREGAGSGRSVGQQSSPSPALRRAATQHSFVGRRSRSRKHAGSADASVPFSTASRQQAARHASPQRTRVAGRGGRRAAGGAAVPHVAAGRAQARRARAVAGVQVLRAAAKEQGQGRAGLRRAERTRGACMHARLHAAGPPPDAAGLASPSGPSQSAPRASPEAQVPRLDAQAALGLESVLVAGQLPLVIEPHPHAVGPLLHLVRALPLAHAARGRGGGRGAGRAGSGSSGRRQHQEGTRAARRRSPSDAAAAAAAGACRTSSRAPAAACRLAPPPSPDTISPLWRR